MVTLLHSAVKYTLYNLYWLLSKDIVCARWRELFNLSDLVCLFVLSQWAWKNTKNTGWLAGLGIAAVDIFYLCCHAHSSVLSAINQTATSGHVGSRVFHRLSEDVSFLAPLFPSLLSCSSTPRGTESRCKLSYAQVRELEQTRCIGMTKGRFEMRVNVLEVYINSIHTDTTLEISVSVGLAQARSNHLLMCMVYWRCICGMWLSLIAVCNCLLFTTNKHTYFEVMLSHLLVVTITINS